MLRKYLTAYKGGNMPIPVHHRYADFGEAGITTAFLIFVNLVGAMLGFQTFFASCLG